MARLGFLDYFRHPYVLDTTDLGDAIGGLSFATELRIPPTEFERLAPVVLDALVEAGYHGSMWEVASRENPHVFPPGRLAVVAEESKPVLDAANARPGDWIAVIGLVGALAIGLAPIYAASYFGGTNLVLTEVGAFFVLLMSWAGPALAFPSQFTSRLIVARAYAPAETGWPPQPHGFLGRTEATWPPMPLATRIEVRAGVVLTENRSAKGQGTWRAVVANRPSEELRGLTERVASAIRGRLEGRGLLPGDGAEAPLPTSRG